MVLKLETNLYYLFKLIFREEEGKRGRKSERGERDTDTPPHSLSHPSMHSLADSRMCPDQGSNPQLQCIKTTEVRDHVLFSHVSQHFVVCVWHTEASQ